MVITISDNNKLKQFILNYTDIMIHLFITLLNNNFEI